MSFAYKLLPQYTYEDYCRWEGKWELINGIPYAMSPAPRPEHQRIAGSLHAELRAAIKKSGCDCSIYQPLDYKIADDTVLNPDLMIVCKPIEKTFLDFAPELVVEILSPATALKDRHTKFEIYEQQKINFYLIIDVDKQDVEIYNLDMDGSYQQLPVVMKDPFQFQLPNCRFSLTFENIWD